ncbi:ABC transporter permease [Aeribacillus composti]|uniref:ABC transporter permease n=1 Tax=Aeribacillus composti TaxID=1868734 RepID=UPI003D1B7E03
MSYTVQMENKKSETGQRDLVKVNVRRTSIKVISILIFLFIWYLVVHFNIQWPLQFGNLPKPTEIIITWLQKFGEIDYYINISVSLFRVLAGILLGLFTSVPIGMWIGLLHNKISEGIFTILELFRPIPLIAYLPVAMLLFHTIESSIIFITLIGAFFPILINTMDATRQVSPTLIQAARCLGSGRTHLISRVYLPAVLSQLFTGLSVGVSASWMGVITAEMMSGKTGIGYATWQAYQLMDYHNSIIGMFTIGILGYVSVAFVRLIEKQIIKWQ